ncbi:hypothetical protein G5B00_08745 [Parapedobacter sp. SGR-10]|uniref:hypothetical protein n=1 Tax=Parapedobacter sp. SGR-10 TaxID=2710879 RepID=UPI0013D889F3|nr:hypothetical protein [Parapedobacter sp. SGR-10]NGF56604.1 hypothetical protein [Parapedobacter sp. SGR-10]
MLSKLSVVKYIVVIVFSLGTVKVSAQAFGSGDIVYVKEGGKGSGSSWSDAMGELSQALFLASDWDPTNDGTLQVWVAAGKYLPTTDPNDRKATFQLVSGVHVYGGFSGEAGTEGNLSTRDWVKNVTILSGDIDRNDRAQVISDPVTQMVGENSYAVVTSSQTSPTAVLDGFTITAGSADEKNTMTCGGGVHNSNGKPTFRNLIITGNISSTGDGICNVNGGAPELTNVKVIHNR